jgi:hypothetical protein
VGLAQYDAKTVVGVNLERCANTLQKLKGLAKTQKSMLNYKASLITVRQIEAGLKNCFRSLKIYSR